MSVAGWYADPYQAGQLRFWDGTAWTDSVAPASDATQPIPFVATEDRSASSGHHLATGRYEPMATWLGATFRALLTETIAVVLLLYLIPFAGAALILTMIFGLLDEIVIDPGKTANPIQGAVEPGAVGAIIGLSLVVSVVALAARLGANHHLHAAHLGHRSSVLGSVGVGLRRLPRAFVWSIVLGLLIAVISVVAVVVYLALGYLAFESDQPGLAAGLAVLVVLVFAMAGLWLTIRLAFFEMALAVGPPWVNPLGQSFGVTAGRFWSTLGRVLVLALIGLAISSLFSVIAQGVLWSGAGEWLSYDYSTDELFINGRAFGPSQEPIQLSELLPPTGLFITVILLSGIGQALTQGIIISGLGHLYGSAGGAAES